MIFLRMHLSGRALFQAPCHRSRRASKTKPQARMHVPSDLFPGGISPETRAASFMSLLCTAVAVRVVLAQLGGGGEGGDLPPTPDFIFLRDFLEERPLTSGSGDEWLEELMARNQLLGMRVLEVREVYCSQDLDWEQCQQLTSQQIQESNVQLLRRHAIRSFGSALQAAPRTQEAAANGDAAQERRDGDSGGA